MQRECHGEREIRVRVSVMSSFLARNVLYTRIVALFHTILNFNLTEEVNIIFQTMKKFVFVFTSMKKR